MLHQRPLHQLIGPLEIRRPPEVLEQRRRLVPGFGSEQAHARAVDLALVEVLPQLHDLVEEGAHREVEEDLAVTRLAGRTLVGAEERVTALLQTEEDAILVVADQLLELGEAKLSPAKAVE